MKTLLLIRHAEAGWGDFGQSDFERTLTQRGLMQADDMAERLKEEGLRPDLILSSTAARTKMTTQHLFAGMAVTWVKSLYLAESEQMLMQIKTIADDVACLAVVAHNPGISECAEAICEKNIHGMAPCTVLAISWPVTHWSEIEQGAGELRAHLYP